jgi:hypothetical protein
VVPTREEYSGKIPFYSELTLIPFEDAIRELRSALGESFVKIIGDHAKTQVEYFFQIRDCALTDRQWQTLKKLFPRR